MQPLYSGSHQGTTKSGKVDVTHQPPVMFAEYFKDIVKGKHLTSLIGHRRTEMTAEDFFFGHDPVKIQVAALYPGFFFGSEPVTFTGKQFMAKLSVKLVVIDIRTIDHTFHLHTDETAAADRIRQQVFAVRGTDERGDTG